MDEILPVTFDFLAGAQSFVKRYRCALCLGHLEIKQEGEREFSVTCPEHGASYKHNTTHKTQAKIITNERSLAGVELRAAMNTERRDPEEIIGELGY